jgi:hypothetical protein
MQLLSSLWTSQGTQRRHNLSARVVRSMTQKVSNAQKTPTGCTSQAKSAINEQNECPGVEVKDTTQKIKKARGGQDQHN